MGIIFHHYIAWQVTDCVSYTTGCCKMTFSVSYLVYSLNYLVCLVIITRTKVRKYNINLKVAAGFIALSLTTFSPHALWSH